MMMRPPTFNIIALQEHSIPFRGLSHPRRISLGTYSTLQCSAVRNARLPLCPESGPLGGSRDIGNSLHLVLYQTHPSLARAPIASQTQGIWDLASARVAGRREAQSMPTSGSQETVLWDGAWQDSGFRGQSGVELALGSWPCPARRMGDGKPRGVRDEAFDVRSWDFVFLSWVGWWVPGTWADSRGRWNGSDHESDRSLPLFRYL